MTHVLLSSRYVQYRSLVAKSSQQDVVERCTEKDESIYKASPIHLQKARTLNHWEELEYPQDRQE